MSGFAPVVSSGTTPTQGTIVEDTLSPDTVIRASSTQVASPLGEEMMILNLQSGVYYGLDPVGARVWELLQEPRPISAIVEALLDEFDVDRRRCEADVLGLVRQLVDARLVELGSPAR